MEALITSIVTSLSVSNAPLVVVGLMVFYFILQNRLALNIKVTDIKEIYKNRTFAYVDDILSGIVNTSYDRMVDKISNDKNIKQDFELEQEKLIYLLTLENVFGIKIKRMVENAILKNGYHDLPEKELQDYCEQKGKRIYECVMVELKRRVKLIPNIAPMLGSNYTEQEAVDEYKNAIYNSIDNNKFLDEKIKKLNKESLLFVGKLVKILQSK